LTHLSPAPFPLKLTACSGQELNDPLPAVPNRSPPFSMFSNPPPPPPPFNERPASVSCYPCRVLSRWIAHLYTSNGPIFFSHIQKTLQVVQARALQSFQDAFLKTRCPAARTPRNRDLPLVSQTFAQVFFWTPHPSPVILPSTTFRS